MKKTILFLFVFAIAIANSSAQEKKAASKTPEQRTEKMVNKLNEVLALNEEQKPKVREVVLKREQNRAELHKKYEKDREGLKKASRESRKASEEELKKILTPEQVEKLKKHREEMKQKHQKNKAQNVSGEEDDE